MSKKDKPIRVKLIVNPGAGVASDSTDNLKLVTGYLKKNGLKADVARAKPKTRATPLAKQAVKDGYKIVIAMGGDGTVEAVMRGMIGSKARLGIIPVGIENNIAKNLGIPENMKEACALVASDDTRKLDVGRVKTGKGKWFSFFEAVCIGNSTAVLPDGNKAIGGEASAVQTVDLPSVQQEIQPKVFLNLDDERIIKAETMLVMVTNTPVFGKKFLVAPGGPLKDGILDISVFQGFSKDDLGGYYASKMNGGYSGSGKVRRYQAGKLKVKSSLRLKVTADGIELGKGMVTIKMRLAALRVIAATKSPDLVKLPKSEAVPVPARDEVVPVPAQDEGIAVPAAQTVENPPKPVSASVKKPNPRKKVIPLQ